MRITQGMEKSNNIFYAINYFVKICYALEFYESSLVPIVTLIIYINRNIRLYAGDTVYTTYV
jgi:hypothetical protein